MNKNKKIFLAFCAVFFIAMGYIAYDMSSRTTFPGSKSNLKERIIPSDTTSQTKTDTLSKVNEE